MLNAPPITELTTESGPRAIFAEWLAKWFDGNVHAVGSSQTATFPKAKFCFGAGQVEGSDVEGYTEIRLVTVARSELAVPAENALFAGKLAVDRMMLWFYVSARASGKGQSQLQGLAVAELLKGILANPDTRFDLAQCGIVNLEPKAPESVGSDKYAKFLVACPAQYQYPIEYGPGDLGGLVIMGDGVQTIPFVRERVLVPGEYLVGDYTFSGPVTVSRARVVAWAPQNTPTVLELEVDGALTGLTLTLPVGTANTNVADEQTGLSLTIGPSQVTRWKIVSGPADGPSAAWHLSLQMDVTAE